jgi:hypothetical protein
MYDQASGPKTAGPIVISLERVTRIALERRGTEEVRMANGGSGPVTREDEEEYAADEYRGDNAK